MESKNKLFLVFFKIGACSIGGGYVMLPILQHELVQKRGWISDDELLDYFAISQATPGIIAINTATFIGYKIAGLPGAFISTMAIVLPSLIIISLIATALSHFNDILLVQNALKGIRIAVAIVLIFTIINLFRKTIKSIPHFAIFTGALLAALAFNISPVYIILSVFALAVLNTLIVRKKQS